MAEPNRTGSPLLADSRIHQGVWDALVGPLPAEGPPSATARCGGHVIEGLTLSAEPDRPGYWRATVPLSSDLISDRVQTVILEIGDGAEARNVGRICVAAGQALLDDLGAEVAALRAELDLLKTVVRRIATAQPAAAAAPRPAADTPGGFQPSGLPATDVALVVDGPGVGDPTGAERTTDPEGPLEKEAAALPAAPPLPRGRRARPAQTKASGPSDAADQPPPADPKARPRS